MVNKNTILIYTDAINMAAYRGLEPKDFKELFMGLFEYSNGVEKTETSFSSKDIYDLFVGYKTKIDLNNDKYEKRKERNKRYYEKNKTSISKKDNLTEETGPQENNEERFVGFLHPRY
mgnify:FL=1